MGCTYQQKRFPRLTVWDVHMNRNIFPGLTVWDVHTNRNVFPGLTVWDVHKNRNVLLGLIVCDIHTNENVFLGFTVWNVHTNGNDWVSMPRPIAHELILPQLVCQEGLSPTVSGSCGKDPLSLTLTWRRFQMPSPKGVKNRVFRTDAYQCAAGGRSSWRRRRCLRK